MGFFGNSGVKIFGVLEIQIFDTRALIDGLNLTSNDIAYGSVNNKTLYGNNGIPDRTYIGDNVNALISGIPYGTTNKTSYDDLVAAKNIQQLTNNMKIEFYPNSQQQGEYSLKITLNGTVTFDSTVTHGTTKVNEEYVLLSSIANNKKNIYLQSHWGSGVTFSNITFS
ncbi:MAG: hypothetical protein ACRC2T_12890 [Thermoguttaceae bacterium]